MHFNQPSDYSLIIYSYLFIIGTCMGSFVQVVGFRIPQKETLRGNSHCNQCGNSLKPWHLIPILSYLILKGKCHYCASKIGWLHPILETLMGFLFLSGAYFLQMKSETIVHMTLACLLVTISISDAFYRIIPNKVLVPFFLIAILERIMIPQNHYWWYPLAGFLVGFFPLFLVRMIRQDSIGGGDIKLFAVIGLFVGPIGSLATLVLSSILALVWHLLTYFMKKKVPKYIAFGPFIAIATYVVYFVTSGQWAFVRCFLVK